MGRERQTERRRRNLAGAAQGGRHTYGAAVRGDRAACCVTVTWSQMVYFISKSLFSSKCIWSHAWIVTKQNQMWNKHLSEGNVRYQ